MATINKNKVSAANSGSCLYTSSGIANRLEIFSNIQFSILRLLSSHMPAHAVALTHASQNGTVEGVMYLKEKYLSESASSIKLEPVITATVIQSLRLQ